MVEEDDSDSSEEEDWLTRCQILADKLQAGSIIENDVPEDSFASEHATEYDNTLEDGVVKLVLAEDDIELESANEDVEVDPTEDNINSSSNSSSISSERSDEEEDEDCDSQHEENLHFNNGEQNRSERRTRRPPKIFTYDEIGKPSFRTR